MAEPARSPQQSVEQKLLKLEVSEEAITALCRRHHVRKLAFFGSVLREDFGPNSDVDVLIEFEPGYEPGFFALFDIAQELSAVLGGRKVDLRTPRDLSRYFRDGVIAGARVCYAEVNESRP